METSNAGFATRDGKTIAYYWYAGEDIGVVWQDPRIIEIWFEGSDKPKPEWTRNYPGHSY
jgi:hypothetical protein